MRLFLLALVFLLFSCAKNNPTIKIKGSDTEVNLAVQLAETFHSKNKRLMVSISGGGSGLGIASLLNGTADMANSSRSINEKEKLLFKEKSIKIDSFIFAQDALAFVVSDRLALDSISVKDLSKILSGEFKNWSALTGKSLPINIYGRQSNSGTSEYVRKILKINYSPYAKQMNGNAQILEAIKADPSGIGYVGAGYVVNGKGQGIRVLKIYTEKSKAISPLDQEAITSGNYFFQRPLFQYFKAEDYSKIKAFLDFERSETGKQIIQSSGYYPAKK